MIRRARSRALLLAFVVGLPMAGAAIACTAGDPISYASGAVTFAEAGDDGGRDGGGVIMSRPPIGDGGIAPLIGNPITCSSLDPDGGCDPTAGMGCCLAGTPVGGTNTCVPQAQHFSGQACKDDHDVFLACLASTTDSTCCWQREGDNRMNTRYRTDCDGGVEACDSTADGGSCTSGGTCTQMVCKGVVVGFCDTDSGSPPPCEP